MAEWRAAVGVVGLISIVEFEVKFFVPIRLLHPPPSALSLRAPPAGATLVIAFNVAVEIISFFLFIV